MNTVLNSPDLHPRERMHSSDGVVLHRSRYKENDLRLVLFLRSIGKVESTARGGRKFSARLKGILEPFTYADYQVFLPGAGVYSRLISGQLKTIHLGLRTDVGRFSLACRVSECIHALIPYRAPAAEVFDILVDTLGRVESAGCNRQLEWSLFAARLLLDLGHGDLRPRFSAQISPARRAAVEAFFGQPLGSRFPLLLPPAESNRLAALATAHLENILPWRLKSPLEIE